MTALGRLAFLLVALVVLAPPPAVARTIVDSAGRSVEVPDRITRAFAAGPPAAVLLYVLAPGTMAGWVRAPTEAEQAFLAPAARGLPETGRLTGRGGALDLGPLTAARPDVIVDFGTVGDAYVELADRVQAETGIPYLLIDGRLDGTPAALRLLGDLLGVPERGETLARAAEEILRQVDGVVAGVPAAERPRLYLARGPEGVETAPRGSINAEILDRVGVNVADGAAGGLVAVTPGQVAGWAPDAVLTLDRGFSQATGGDPAWRDVPAVAAGRVLLAPGLPFGFVDAPPSVNRLVGLVWLLHALYPDRAPGDLREQVRAFYALFYQVELTESDLDRLLDGSGG